MRQILGYMCDDVVRDVLSKACLVTGSLQKLSVVGYLSITADLTGCSKYELRHSLSADLMKEGLSYQSKTMVRELRLSEGFRSSRTIPFCTTSARSLKVRKWFSFTDWRKAIQSMIYAEEVASGACGSDATTFTQLDSSFLARSALLVFIILPPSLKSAGGTATSS